jgi:serine protease Do
MKRWIALLTFSLAIGAGLAWLARPMEVHFRWGSGANQTARISLDESVARAERSQEEQQGIDGAMSLSRAFSAVAREVSPSIVTIYSERNLAAGRSGGGPNRFNGMIPPQFFDHFFQMPDQAPVRGMGSGVIVSSEGRVLTNNHVVAGADRVKVTLADGRSFDAEVVGTDPKTDIAVVKIDAHGLPAATLGDSDELQVGEWVLAIGNPFELTQTVTAGIVSAKGRSGVGLEDYENFIQTDAAINPGNSGGALVDLKGEVVGINTAIASRSGGYQGVGFAIPINMAGRIMDSLVKTGKVVRGWIGVTIQGVTDTMADNYGLDRPQGALVNSVARGGPAEDAGIEPGDLILELDGRPLRDSADLRLQVGEIAPGTTIELTLIRGGDRKHVRVKLGELPGDDELAGGMREDRTEDSSDLGTLGFEVERIDANTRAQLQLDADVTGLVVTNVQPGSPASDSGLREGDVLLEAGRKPLSSVSSLNSQIDAVAPGKTLLLKVRRQDANVYLALRVPKS